MGEGKAATLGKRQRISYGREKEIQKTEWKRREGRTTSMGWDLDRVLGRCFVLFHLWGAEWKKGARDRDGKSI